MTPPVLPTTAFVGDVPAALRCGFCGQPVKQEFYRTLNRFACSNCAAQVNQVIDRNAVALASFLAAAGVGLATALAGAAVWAAVVHITHVNIGILAFFIGVAVGKVVLFSSGKRRAVSLQWLSTILAIVGVAAGKVAVVSWEIVDALHQNGVVATPGRVWQLLNENPRLVGQPFDLVWMGIAAYAAWRLCKPQKFSMAGPYAYQPTSNAMQFNTVEPLNDLPPATPRGKP